MEKLKNLITNQQKTSLSVKTETNLEKNHEEFIDYIKWLSTEGMLKYQVKPLSRKSFKFKHYK